MTYRHKSFAQSEVLLEFEKLADKNFFSNAAILDPTDVDDVTNTVNNITNWWSAHTEEEKAMYTDAMLFLGITAASFIPVIGPPLNAFLSIGAGIVDIMHGNYFIGICWILSAVPALKTSASAAKQWWLAKIAAKSAKKIGKTSEIAEATVKALNPQAMQFINAAKQIISTGRFANIISFALKTAPAIPILDEGRKLLSGVYPSLKFWDEQINDMNAGFDTANKEVVSRSKKLTSAADQAGNHVANMAQLGLDEAEKEYQDK
jgi:hypothetical protein